MPGEIGSNDEQWLYDPLAFEANATHLPSVQSALAAIWRHRATLHRIENTSDPSLIDWRERAEIDPGVREATSALQYSVGIAIDALTELFKADYALTQARRAAEDEIAADAIALQQTEIPDDLSELDS